MNKLIVASHNSGKVREIANELSAYQIDVSAQSEFDIGSAAETAPTFVENALIKARHACLHTGLPALADDSGLEVNVLQGQPGIYSARYAGENATDAMNNEKLLKTLQAVPEEKRQARYQCFMVFLRTVDDPTPIICQGTWEGTILSSPQGDGGFGYDPLFYIAELECTAAELDINKKNKLSHRGKALKAMLPNIAAYFQSHHE